MKGSRKKIRWNSKSLLGAALGAVALLVWQAIGSWNTQVNDPSLSALALGQRKEGNTAQGALAGKDSKDIAYRVLSCNDGDTCRLKASNNEEIKVRLVGIDAPEFKGNKKLNQPLSLESKEFLNSLVQGKDVFLQSYGLDRYNRNLAEIIVGEVNANLEMVKQGFAEVYKGRPPRGMNVQKYTIAEKEAKDLKRGVWALQKYESPKDFRARLK